MRSPRVLIVIPALNEATQLGQVIKHVQSVRLTALNSIDIVVIDDGSTDNTAEIARKCGVQVLTHRLNRGLGVALGTGLSYAKKFQYNYMVTFDADGQHSAKDIKKLLAPLIENRADVCIGSRLVHHRRMPMMRKIVNVLSNMITYALFGIWTTDSQSGLRAFNSYAINHIKIRSQRMEVSSEIFKEIARLRLKTIEIPIQPVYTEYSLSKGQKISNAPNVAYKLFLQKFT